MGKQGIFNSLILFLSFLSVLIFAYSPAISGHYLFHDDYLYWRNDLRDVGRLYIAMGRPVGFLIYTVICHTAHTVSDFNTIRFLSLILVVLCAWLLFEWIKPYFSRKGDAFLAACIVFTLPPFQSVVSWVGCLHVSVAAFFAMLAVVTTNEAFESNVKVSLKPLALSLVFLMVSLLTYQTSAMLFWAMLAVRFFFHGYRKNFSWPQMGYLMGTGLISMALYDVILNVWCKPYAKYLSSIYDPYALTSDYGGKLVWFIREPLYNSINLWNIFPNMMGVKITVIAFVCGGLLAAVRSPAVQQKRGSLFGFSGLFIVLVILSYLPNLLNAKPAPFYRTCTGLEMILVFAWYAASRQFIFLLPESFRSLALTMGLVVACCFGSFRCYENILLYRVIPSQMEFNYVKDVLAAHDLNRYRKIIIIQPSDLTIRRYDEFGILSSTFPQDVPCLIKCAIGEIGKSKTFDASFQSYPYSFTDDERQKDISALILNMRIPEREYIKRGQSPFWGQPSS